MLQTAASLRARVQAKPWPRAALRFSSPTAAPVRLQTDRSSLRAFFAALGRRRALGVGAAVVLEVVVLAGLALADPVVVIGIPAAVTAAIGGTVAVVFRPADGVAVALVGAVVFVVVGGWGPGELAAIAVWPAIVAAAGVFGRQVAQQRLALGRAVARQELERKRLALELHEETAQRLTGALLLVTRAERAAGGAGAAAANCALRELIAETIAGVRRLALDLRPSILDDFGLVPALERLAALYADETGVDVVVEGDVAGPRLPSEAELALFRIAQEALANSREHAGARNVRLTLERTSRSAAIVIEDDGRGFAAGKLEDCAGLAAVRDRVALLGGRLSVDTAPGAGTRLRAGVPISCGLS